MYLHHRIVICAALAAVAFVLSSTADAKPTIRIQPGATARFLPDQRFDLRVEFTPAEGRKLTSVAIEIDGKPIPVDTGQLDDRGGFTARNLSSTVAGRHTIVASASESDDPERAVARSHFEIVPVAGPKRRYRNVIICLGDGMGIQHRTAARVVRHGYTDGKANGKLAMDEFPVTGMVMTSALNALITDSSPGMAGYSTGNKALNDTQGVFPDNTRAAFDNPRVEYLGAYLNRKLGKSLGIVTTADVEDATPAANAVHTANRDLGTGICDQYFDERNRNGLAVLMGGGRRWFLPASTPGSSRAEGSDYELDERTAMSLGVAQGRVDPERNLLGEFEHAGFTYLATATDLKNAANRQGTRSMLGLFAYGNMNSAYDKIAKRRNPGVPGIVDDFLAPDQPMLDEMAEAALAVLNRNSKGFVLLVEGAHIDKQTHAMDADRAIWDTLEFDNAVRACMQFAEKDGNTLVIVVSDHECGGFSVIGALKGPASDVARLPSDSGILAAPGSIGPDGQPVAAPARQLAVGTYEDGGFPKYEIAADGFPVTSDVDGRLVIGYGANADRYETWLAKPVPVIDTLLDGKVKKDLFEGNIATRQKYPPRALDRSEQTAGFFVRGQVPGKSSVHTASDVPISAFGGPAALQFTGVQDNTDVFFKLARAVFGGY